MATASSPQVVVRFGVFEADLQSRELRKQGLKVKLQEQPFCILEILLRHPGELVLREELRQRMWSADTFVDFELGLNTAINRLRQALGDSADNPRFVETLPRRGYRFIAPVDRPMVVPGGAPSPDASAPTARPFDEHASADAVRKSPRQLVWVLALAGVSLAALVGLLVTLNVGGLRERMLGRVNVGHIRSLAVLPLENLSRDPAQDYFAEGMTDEIITSLAKLQTLKVISRSSVVHYKGTNKPLPEMARELNVDGIIEGTVLRSGNRVRITVQLLRAATDQHLWAETYEGNVEDVLRLQDAVARAVAAEIRLKLGPEQEARLAKSPSVNPSSYETYLRGRYHFYERGGKAGFFAASRHYFEEAIAIDPQYAPAYAGLADYYTLKGSMERSLTNREAMEKAKELAAKALQLDDGLADAHIARANVLFRYDWNWAEAEKEFRRGIELNLNAPSSYLYYAMYMGVLGRHDEAIAAMRRAIELDPFSAFMNSNLGVVLHWSGCNDEAAEQERKAIALDPVFPQSHLILAQVYDQLGRYDEAIVEHLETDTLEGIDPSAVAGFKRAYRSSGINGYRRKRLEWEEQRVRSGKANYYRMAKLSADLGDADGAFQWLERAYQDRHVFMPNIKVEAELRSLHGDPRFADLVRRVGLP